MNVSFESNQNPYEAPTTKAQTISAAHWQKKQAYWKRVFWIGAAIAGGGVLLGIAAPFTQLVVFSASPTPSAITNFLVGGACISIFIGAVVVAIACLRRMMIALRR